MTGGTNGIFVPTGQNGCTGQYNSTITRYSDGIYEEEGFCGGATGAGEKKSPSQLEIMNLIRLALT